MDWAVKFFKASNQATVKVQDILISELALSGN